MVLGNLFDNFIDKNGTVAMQASKNQMEFVNSWILMSTPMTPALILATYLLLVLKIGPNYMRDRKPYHFPNLMLLYNLVQVILSVYLLYATSRMLVYNGLLPKTCALDSEFNRRGIATAMHHYLLGKVSELLDTVFFILRKKDKQVSFLHVYHHTVMVIVTWSALKYEPTIHLMFLGSINSLVHALMYTYYGLSAYPSLLKYLWWKKYITSLQLVQFVIVMLIFTAAYAYSECTPSYILIAALSWNSILFLFLFGKFYVNTYMKNKIKGAKDKMSNGTKYDSAKYYSENGNMKNGNNVLDNSHPKYKTKVNEYKNILKNR